MLGGGRGRKVACEMKVVATSRVPSPRGLALLPTVLVRAVGEGGAKWVVCVE